MQIFAVLLWFLKVVNEALNVINAAVSVANHAIDMVLPWLGLLGIVGYIAYSLIKNINKYQLKKKSNKNEDGPGDILTRLLILIALAIFFCLIFWWFPIVIYSRLGWSWATPVIRWIEFGFIITLLAYIYGHKYGENRWITSAIGHFSIILLGWLMKGWVGILLISLPLIMTYYLALYQLAMVTLPVNNPEDNLEKRRRFLILVSYTWGAQFPLYVVGEHAWKKPETRIPGSFTRSLPMGIPGLIWVKPHQAVGITSGIQFKRVDGPGLVFMGKMERPFQVVDLRSQIRVSDIDVVSKEGINFRAVVLIGFRMDPDTWDRDTYNKLRTMNSLLRGADKPSYTDGSFPFSNLRIQAALGTTSTPETGDAIIYWDQWVVNIIEDAARKVISQKTLDELWRPVNDQKGINALDGIAAEIKSSAELSIRSAGILLFVARVVNFSFPTAKGQPDKISEQQITTWESEWERKRTKILDEAQAESDRAQNDAHAYAESILLNSIAEGLQKTHEIHPRLPRYVIAVRFLRALQNYIQKVPKEEGEENSESDKKVAGLDSYLRFQENAFLSSSGKEQKK
jgi:hypothetical protein